MEKIDEEMVQDEENAARVDAYKMVAVVDAGRSFANNEVSNDAVETLKTNKKILSLVVRVCEHA